MAEASLNIATWTAWRTTKLGFQKNYPKHLPFRVGRYCPIGANASSSQSRTAYSDSLHSK